ncbi:MAG: InlB B-repeat-containing protein [Lachnospiraceae bacterium]|nr:InlB B-repeat-containing protein [Lachnospiraceae bacterium]
MSVFLWTNSTAVAEADTYTEMMSQFPGVTVSDDGTGWTTDYKLQIAERHNYGYTVTTGATSTKAEAGQGEHYYSKDATGLIPISKWTLRHPPAQCIHDHDYHQNKYGGFEIGNQICGTSYSSGWFATCANCNEEIEHFVYSRESTVSGITFIPADSLYVYVCPFCNNMEQGVEYSHRCFSYVSKNYYRIQYVANYPADSPNTEGWMTPTKHMVDNATEYEGKPATERGFTDTHLRKNTYYAEGYVFTGWNTEIDGSGTSYADEEAINLCPDEDGKRYILFAQWERKSSTLVIDENGGTYYGYTGPITQDYGSTWEFEESKITPPAGPTVTFEHNGGSGTASIQSTKSYKSFTISTPTHGLLVGNRYTFLGASTTDTITLNYRQNSIILPTSTRSGYSFAGWYFDEACTKPVGVAGDEYMPPGDVTLYALWADLVLTSVDDYDSNGGKGAVDLSWIQGDGENKIYQVYQYSELDAAPKQVGSATDTGVGESVSETFTFTGDTSKTYTVPASGYYTLVLDGAQGGNYTDTTTGTTYTGGLGGRTTARIYLEQGEILTYNIGGQNGYNGGGKATDYGNGGGYSIVSSNLKGELLIAGGGAGATDISNGNPGGDGTGLTTGRDGQDGMAGGGGGAQGGSSEDKTEAPHVHSGNKLQGGGCYTVPIYGHREHTEVMSVAGSCYTTFVNKSCTVTHYCTHTIEDAVWTCNVNNCGTTVYGKKCFYGWADCAGNWQPCGGSTLYNGVCSVCGATQGTPTVANGGIQNGGCNQSCSGQGHTCGGMNGYACSLQDSDVVTEWALGCGHEAYAPYVMETEEYANFTYQKGTGHSQKVYSGYSAMEQVSYYGAYYYKTTAGNLVLKSSVIETPDTGNLFFDVSNYIYEGENVYQTGAHLSNTSYTVSVLNADTGTIIATRDIISNGIAHTETGTSTNMTCTVSGCPGTHSITVYDWEYTENAADIFISGTRKKYAALSTYHNGSQGAVKAYDIVDAAVMVPITDDVNNVQIVVDMGLNSSAGNVTSFLSNIQYQWNGNGEMTDTPKEAVAYGGSNYVNDTYCTTYDSESGVVTGNGLLSITSESTGFVTSTTLSDVAATDMAAPDAVDIDTVVKTGISKTQYRITFDKPADHGTAYYHYVKSFDSSTGDESLTSNTTLNTLTSGVARYYYIYDTSSSTGVTSAASYVTTESITVTVPAAGTTKYLHIAAADKAGNLSQTIHITLREPALETDVVYEPEPNTEQIQITLGDGVATGADDRTFYVRSDGNAVIELSEYAYLTDDGSRAAAQVDTVRWNVCNTAFGIYEWAESIIPYAPDTDTIVYGNDELQTGASAQDRMQLYGVEAKRYGADAVDVFHRYTIPGTYSGQTFVVYPGAYTTYQHKLYASDDAADRGNYISLICDGVAPVISGLDAIVDVDVLNMTEAEKTFTITATDDLSGLQDFTITLNNRDCAMTKIYRDEDDGAKDGVITILVPKFVEGDLTGIEFCGDFTVTGSAVDKVGNVRLEKVESLEVALTADLQRMLAPHAPIFKCGESGILTVNTWGYVEKVQVQFPECLGLDTMYVYEEPPYTKQEQLEFMIPLDFPEGDYTVIVTGYKTGTMLEQSPEILHFTVRGSVLDELRTRLR